MPTYEYRCDGCGHEFEIEQRITADKLTTCPTCNAEKLVRLVSAGNFILKGGGWYADLYHKPKAADSGGASGGASPASSSPAPSAAPSTPAPAAPSTPASSGGSSGSSGGGSSGGSGGGGTGGAST